MNKSNERTIREYANDLSDEELLAAAEKLYTEVNEELANLQDYLTDTYLDIDAKNDEAQLLLQVVRERALGLL